MTVETIISRPTVSTDIGGTRGAAGATGTAADAYVASNSAASAARAIKTSAEVRDDMVETSTYDVVAKGSPNAQHTGAATQVTLQSVTIPGGSMGASGQLRITALVSCNNNGNTKVVYFILGGQTILSDNLSGSDCAELQRRVANRNSETSQVTLQPATAAAFGNVVGARFETTLNTAADVTLEIAAFLANAADQITLDSYLVEIFPGT